jgi:hypothetical protein
MNPEPTPQEPLVPSVTTPQPATQVLPQDQPQASAQSAQVIVGMGGGGIPPVSKQSNGKKIILIVTGVVLVVCLLGGALYALTSKKEASDESSSQQESSRANKVSESKVTSSTKQQKMNDVDIKTNLKHDQVLLEMYYNDNASEATGSGYYPTLANLNDPTFRQSHGLGSISFDPSDTTKVFADSPGANVFAYIPQPASCDNAMVPCTGYSLVAVLSSGEKIEKKSLAVE